MVTIMPKGWKYLAKGSFNTVYQSMDNSLVLKLPINKNIHTDTPERSIRLWNMINPDIKPPAHIQQTEEGRGWVCPFIQGVQASDKEMSDCLIDIYNRTGRIVVDATAPKNFIKTKAGNQIVCVDIGMALQMEYRQDTHYTDVDRRKSLVSLNAWNNYKEDYEDFFENNESTHPETINIVKALVFIKSNRPDIYDVSFLKTNPESIKQLAAAFDHKTHNATIIGYNLLEQQISSTLYNIKESCLIELQRYIDSRGSINIEGVFEPSNVTKIFRDIILTNNKVEAIKLLMNQIEKAKSPEEIQNYLLEKSTEQLFSGKYNHEFEHSIGQCLKIIRTDLTDPNSDIRHANT